MAQLAQTFCEEVRGDTREAISDIRVAAVP